MPAAIPQPDPNDPVIPVQPVQTMVPEAEQQPADPTSYQADIVEPGSQRGIADRSNELIAEGSPLMQLGTTRAKQARNATNTLNSSMAAGDVRRANLEYATPIATKEYETETNQLQVNQAAKNRASEFNANFRQQLGLTEAGGEQDRLNIEASGGQERLTVQERGEIESRLTAERGDIELALETASGLTRENLLTRQGEVDLELQNGRIQNEQYLQEERNQLDIDMQGLDIAERIRAQDRQREIDIDLIGSRTNQESYLMAQKAGIDERLLGLEGDERIEALREQGSIDAQLADIRGNIEIGLINERGNIEKDLQTAEGIIRSGLLEQQGIIDGTLIDLRDKHLKEVMTQQEGITSRIQAQQGVIDLQSVREQGQIARTLQHELYNINLDLAKYQTASQASNLYNQAQHEQALQAQRAQIETSLQTLVGVQALEQQGLKGEQAAELTVLEGDYKTLIQTSQSASVFYSNVSTSISEILANPEILANQKQELIDKQVDLLKSGLAFMGGLADVDMTGLLDFSIGNSTGNNNYSGPGPDGLSSHPGEDNSYNYGNYQNLPETITNSDGVPFNESTYLAANPNVAAAVARGEFASGADHYNLYGKNENRSGAFGGSQEQPPPPSPLQSYGNEANPGAYGMGTNIGTGGPVTQGHIDAFNNAMPGWDENDNNQIDPDEWAAWQLQQSSDHWSKPNMLQNLAKGLNSGTLSPAVQTQITQLYNSVK
jgi:hypothetical protein